MHLTLGGPVGSLTACVGLIRSDLKYEIRISKSKASTNDLNPKFEMALRPATAFSFIRICFESRASDFRP